MKKINFKNSKPSCPKDFFEKLYGHLDNDIKKNCYDDKEFVNGVNDAGKSSQNFQENKYYNYGVDERSFGKNGDILNKILPSMPPPSSSFFIPTVISSKSFFDYNISKSGTEISAFRKYLNIINKFQN